MNTEYSPSIITVLNTLITYAEILDKRSADSQEGNCVSLELTKQQARIALTEALSSAPQDVVIDGIVDTSIRTEYNLSTICKIVNVLLVNHSIMLECLLLESHEGLVECLRFQGSLLKAITSLTPSDAFAHIRNEVLSNVQGQ
jgi:hypothetical protein